MTRELLFAAALARAERLMKLGEIYGVDTMRPTNQGDIIPVRVIADARTGERLTVYVTARFGVNDRRVTTLQATTQSSLDAPPYDLQPSKIAGWFQAHQTQGPELPEKGDVMDGTEYLIDYVVKRRAPGDPDFVEVGFGSSGAWEYVDAALYSLASTVQNRLWETEPGQPDPATVDGPLS